MIFTWLLQVTGNRYMTYFNTISHEELQAMVSRYPWWSSARMELLRRRFADSNVGSTSEITLTSGEDALIARLHPTATIPLQHVDIARLTQLTPDDLIERFLKRDDYRIVAESGNAEDLSQVEIDTEDDLVSEELAEIYLNQGLYDDAIDTYRKLSLLNSEKSIYFAELIARIEDKKNR